MLIGQIITVITMKVLISTYWNVNSKFTTKKTHKTVVLISTYWNVNKEVFFPTANQSGVLISTYWNVNIVYII